MIGMGFLRLNKMLAKHKHTPSLGHDEDVPSISSDPDFRLLTVIVPGALVVGFIAWASWERTAANNAFNRWIVFISLAVILTSLYSLWLRTDDSPLRARRTIAILGFIGAAIAFCCGLTVGNMLETYLYALSVYLLLVGVVSNYQYTQLSKAKNRIAESEPKVT